jgi:hypothetical protein
MLNWLAASTARAGVLLGDVDDLRAKPACTINVAANSEEGRTGAEWRSLQVDVFTVKILNIVGASIIHIPE